MAALPTHFMMRPALTAAVVIGVTAPVGPALTKVPVARAATVLTAGESLFNVPLNLFQDIVNIPYYETRALNTAAESLLFTGPWFVGSPTNVWGEDPGDPGHFESLIETLVPFPQISGIEHQGDYSYPGLDQQISMLAAAEIPANPTCESLDCLPMIPTSPITGLTGLDQLIWSALAITFQQKFPLIDNWFQVPFSEMTQGDGYYFSPGAPGSIDSGPAYAYPGLPWPGTHHPSAAELAQYPNLTPDTNLMPWAGEHFKLDLSAPFQNFFNSLQQPFDAGDFHLPNLVDVGRSLQAVVAGSVLDFNPFVHASPLCPGACVLPDGSQTYEGFIKAVSALWPGNNLLDDWMTLYNEGQANVSTPEIRDYLTWAWQHQSTLFDFYNGRPEPYGNALPPDPVINTSNILPTMDQVNSEVTQLLGKPTDVFLDNSGILGPFNWAALSNMFVPGSPAPSPEVPGPTDAVPDAGAPETTALSDLAGAVGLF